MRPLPFPCALAFDLDGTLIDSRGDIAAACNHVLTRAGRTPLDEAVVATFIGDGARTLLARAFGVSESSPRLDAWHDEFVLYYDAHPVGRTRWMPGAIAALDELARGSVPLAVVTNKTQSVALTILEALGARERFAAVCGAGEGPLKPDPAPVRRVAAAVGVPTADLWVVGDGAQDVVAGRAAGSATIGVLGGFHPEESLRASDPDRLIRSLAELPGLIDEARTRAPA